MSTALGLQGQLYGCSDKSDGQWQEKAYIKKGLERGSERRRERRFEAERVHSKISSKRRKSCTNMQVAQHG